MTVTAFVDGEATPAPPGQSLFACADALGVRVPTSCFRQGKCRECLVEVEEGMELLQPRTEEETHLGGRFRLSCRALVAAEEGTLRCHTLRRGALRILDEASLPSAAPPRLEPAVEASGPDTVHGVAVDLGTTTVAVRLYDLFDGRLVAAHSFENPQRFGGTDVMARIRYDGENKGRLLQRTLLGYLGHTLEAFPCEADAIREVLVAGNTTMRDLFFGLDVASIGVRPYRSTTEAALRAGERADTAVATTARKLRLPAHPDAPVVGLPLISGHVGADAAAGLLATGIGSGEGLAVFMDVGTNTELVVGNRERLLAASCPAGPAFEGGAIACGMPALPGAIERVRIASDGSVELGVVGDAPPAGICGSGLVDALGELLRTGRMNAQGRFDDDLEGRFVLDEASGVHLGEPDVNELAQAKGANVAGLLLVLSEYGAALDDVETLFLAGGFAHHLDLAAARRIGLVPDLPDERILQVGNTALEGAARALLSTSARREVGELVQRIEHVELETNPGFFDYFVDGCQFEAFRA